MHIYFTNHVQKYEMERKKTCKQNKALFVIDQTGWPVVWTAWQALEVVSLCNADKRHSASGPATWYMTLVCERSRSAMFLFICTHAQVLNRRTDLKIGIRIDHVTVAWWRDPQGSEWTCITIHRRNTHRSLVGYNIQRGVFWKVDFIANIMI